MRSIRNLRKKDAELKLMRAFIDKDLELIGSLARSTGASKYLTAAIGTGQLDIVKVLLKARVNVNHKNAFGNTPLFHAIFYKRYEIANYLLDQGADASGLTIELFNYFLSLSPEQAHPLIEKTKANLDMSVLNELLNAELKKAAKANDVVGFAKLRDFYQLLINDKRDLKVFMSSFAYKYDSADILHYLSSQKSFAASSDALIEAIARDNKKVVYKFLELCESKFADKSVQLTSIIMRVLAAIEHDQSDLIGPLATYAAKHGSPEQVEEVAKINKQIWNYIYQSDATDLFSVCDALSVNSNQLGLGKVLSDQLNDAVQVGDQEEVERIYLAGHHLKLADWDKVDAFFKAIKCQNSQAVAFFIKNGINVNVNSETYSTPLSYATFCGHHDIVVQLLNSGAGIDITDKSDCNALIYAVNQGRLSIAKLLIEYGANLLPPDGVKRTALNSAVSAKVELSDKIKLIDMLLEAHDKQQIFSQAAYDLFHDALWKRDPLSTSLTALIASYLVRNKSHLTPKQYALVGEAKSQILDHINELQEEHVKLYYLREILNPKTRFGELFRVKRMVKTPCLSAGNLAKAMKMLRDMNTYDSLLTADLVAALAVDKEHDLTQIWHRVKEYILNPAVRVDDKCELLAIRNTQSDNIFTKLLSDDAHIDAVFDVIFYLHDDLGVSAEGIKKLLFPGVRAAELTERQLALLTKFDVARDERVVAKLLELEIIPMHVMRAAGIEVDDYTHDGDTVPVSTHAGLYTVLHAPAQQASPLPLQPRTLPSAPPLFDDPFAREDEMVQPAESSQQSTEPPPYGTVNTLIAQMPSVPRTAQPATVAFPSLPRHEPQVQAVDADEKKPAVRQPLYG